MKTLSLLSNNDLQILISALRSGRLTSTIYRDLPCNRILSNHIADSLATDLNDFLQNGFNAEQIASILELVKKDRTSRPLLDEMIHLVSTGPEAGATANRDTAVVVRELFANAQSSVLVAGYSVYQGKKVFEALADRMLHIPELQVRMFLAVHNANEEMIQPEELVKRFAARFIQYDWPQDRPLPSIFYYPLSLEKSMDQRACIHAKCIIVDGLTVFVGSANFTEASQARNIELGLPDQ